MKTIKDKYYKYILKGKRYTISEEIVFKIIRDFTDRRGLRQEWEQIDGDIQNEIINTWINLVQESLNE